MKKVNVELIIYIVLGIAALVAVIIIIKKLKAAGDAVLIALGKKDSVADQKVTAAVNKADKLGLDSPWNPNFNSKSKYATIQKLQPEVFTNASADSIANGIFAGTDTFWAKDVPAKVKAAFLRIPKQTVLCQVVQRFTVLHKRDLLSYLATGMNTAGQTETLNSITDYIDGLPTGFVKKTVNVTPAKPAKKK